MLEEERPLITDESLANRPADASSEIVLTTYNEPHDNAVVLGVTLLGRIHKHYGNTCQDYHLFSDLGDDWHLYVVSDGAGSAALADKGARWNCVIAEYLIKGMIERTDWKERESLPSELEWYHEFYAVCRKVKQTIEERCDSLDEQVRYKDFNATLLVLIVTPQGMLTGHIGDGRMGYQNRNGEWLSVMTPHKGQEANQTIFVMNKWDEIVIPSLKMSAVSVPEVRVVQELPLAVLILTDGCENFSWECLQPNETTGKLEDKNKPFKGFWEPLIKMINDTPPNERLGQFAQFIDSNTYECCMEQDDRTVIMGLYHRSTDESPNQNEER